MDYEKLTDVLSNLRMAQDALKVAQNDYNKAKDEVDALIGKSNFPKRDYRKTKWFANKMSKVMKNKWATLPPDKANEWKMKLGKRKVTNG